ncbi:MAG: hypothetical protein AB8B72_12855 [Crocinitomicaceae bacterium]
MKANWLKALILTLLISSCGSPRGKLYQIDNLEIYYDENKGTADFVKPLGAFFKDNGLVHPNQKHSVKLTSTPNEFVLKMILNDSLEKVPVDLLKEIEYLEAAIGETVFKNANFAIVITDAYFKPLSTSEN